MRVNMTTAALTLEPNVLTQLLPGNAKRTFLLLQVTGTSPASFGWGQWCDPGAGKGHSLDGASAAGGQGGSIILDAAREWDEAAEGMVATGCCPLGPISVVAAEATTVIAIEGIGLDPLPEELG